MFLKRDRKNYDLGVAIKGWFSLIYNGLSLFKENTSRYLFIIFNYLIRKTTQFYLSHDNTRHLFYI